MELHEIISVSDTDEPGVYLAKVDLTDMVGERYTCEYVVRPDDNFGLAPVIRSAVSQWIADGRPVDPGAIDCPLFLLAGETDHITPAPQVFAFADVVATPAADVVQRTTPGGHLGLFMGHDALATAWPELGAQVRARSI